VRRGSLQRAGHWTLNAAKSSDCLLKLECTEHRAESKMPLLSQDRDGSVSPEVKARSIWKTFARCWPTLRRHWEHLRIRQVEEMFGYAVSEGTVQSARQEQYQALEPFEERLKKILPQEPVLLWLNRRLGFITVEHVALGAGSFFKRSSKGSRAWYCSWRALARCLR